jgi:hypothetical protein
MEEGFYEINVDTLAVNELYPDANKPGGIVTAGGLLPGDHGKGLYSGQGKLIYANNGEYSDLALTRPDIASGALASWDGRDWTVVRRNQFTEVTGPGGLYGNTHPASDPVWSIGWDHRSLILMLFDRGEWHSFRLPKASHSYDGAHGWYTEWPRIRDIGEKNLLMTMHGTFWKFPRAFRLGKTGGITPRSTYLKVIGDFCRWNDQLVFGCDDAARSEFLNKRKAKGELAAPAQSQSNLWFVEPEQIDDFGSPIGRGAVWLEDEVRSGEVSEPYLFRGYQRRAVHIVHDSKNPVVFRFEVDSSGDGSWTLLEELEVSPNGYRFWDIPGNRQGVWVRVSPNRGCRATVWFEYRNDDPRSSTPDGRFEGLGEIASSTTLSGGLLRAGEEEVGLQVMAVQTSLSGNRPIGYYELSPGMKLRRVESRDKEQWMAEHVSIPSGALKLDGDSILYIDDVGNRFRLPVGNRHYLEQPGLLEMQRIDREVSTERDLFHCAGTFYELPAQNAGGFSKIRPISSHSFFIHDYCSWRGMLVLSGIGEGGGENQHIVRSDDQKCAVWLGTLDDLWKLGKAVGEGGPWYESPVTAGIPSDPYLMAGYDHKQLSLSHQSRLSVSIDVQIDLSGTRLWKTYKTIQVPAGDKTTYRFPEGFSAYWIRFVSSTDCIATARMTYQ